MVENKDSILREAYLLILTAMVLAFATYCLHLGYNGTVISSVFAFAGAIAGYIFGRYKLVGVQDAERTIIKDEEERSVLSS